MWGSGKEVTPPYQKSWGMDGHRCHVCSMGRVKAAVDKPSPEGFKEEIAGISPQQGHSVQRPVGEWAAGQWLDFHLAVSAARCQLPRPGSSWSWSLWHKLYALCPLGPNPLVILFNCAWNFLPPLFGFHKFEIYRQVQRIVGTHTFHSPGFTKN